MWKGPRAKCKEASVAPSETQGPFVYGTSVIIFQTDPSTIMLTDTRYSARD